MIKGEPIYINGDGQTSRDFCYIDNVVQINLLAATTKDKDAINQIYNVAVGGQTTLNQLNEYLRDILSAHMPSLKMSEPYYQNFRAGDVRHSLADISKAKTLLGYDPYYLAMDGLKIAMQWYLNHKI